MGSFKLAPGNVGEMAFCRELSGDFPGKILSGKTVVFKEQNVCNRGSLAGKTADNQLVTSFWMCLYSEHLQ